MTMDDTLIHNANNLEKFIGYSKVEEPLVLQLGGCDAKKLGEAAFVCERYKQTCLFHCRYIFTLRFILKNIISVDLVITVKLTLIVAVHQIRQSKEDLEQN
jgi:hypothetical protein